MTYDPQLNKRCFVAMIHNGDMGSTMYLEDEESNDQMLGFFNMLYGTDSKLSK